MIPVTAFFRARSNPRAASLPLSGVRNSSVKSRNASPFFRARIIDWMKLAATGPGSPNMSGIRHTVTVGLTLIIPCSAITFCMPYTLIGDVGAVSE